MTETLEPVAEYRVLAALRSLGWKDDRTDRHRPGLLYGWAEDAIRAVDAADRDAETTEHRIEVQP